MYVQIEVVIYEDDSLLPLEGLACIFSYSACTPSRKAMVAMEDI
jgi:hypothetical protein